MKPQREILGGQQRTVVTCLRNTNPQTAAPCLLSRRVETPLRLATLVVGILAAAWNSNAQWSFSAVTEHTFYPVATNIVVNVIGGWNSSSLVTNRWIVSADASPDGNGGGTVSVDVDLDAWVGAAGVLGGTTGTSTGANITAEEDAAKAYGGVGWFGAPGTAPAGNVSINAYFEGGERGIWAQGGSGGSGTLNWNGIPSYNFGGAWLEFQAEARDSAGYSTNKTGDIVVSGQSTWGGALTDSSDVDWGGNTVVWDVSDVCEDLSNGSFASSANYSVSWEGSYPTSAGLQWVTASTYVHFFMQAGAYIAVADDDEYGRSSGQAGFECTGSSIITLDF